MTIISKKDRGDNLSEETLTYFIGRRRYENDDT